MKAWRVGVAGACLLGCVAALGQGAGGAAEFLAAKQSAPTLKSEAEWGRERERLDAVAKSYTAGNAFMGAVLVVDGERTLLDKGYGMADLEWGIANAPEVKFRLGSLTKQFTAALVLLLQQDGKLRIEDPVSKYLADAPSSWDKITVKELLGHTSGIVNFTSLPEFRAWSMLPRTPDQEVDFFRDKPLEFEPGTKFAYSNSNYEVLGLVIERVSEKKYGALLRERILDPLGMKDTGLDTDELVLPKRAQGYRPGRGGLVLARSESMAVPWAAGSIYSTTGDLLRWERGLFGGKVLNDASLKAMTTAGMGGYGLGVMVAQVGDAKVVQHGGAIEGFNTFLSYVPERKIAVAVLSNVSGPAADKMAGQLLNVAMGKPVVLANERKAVLSPYGEKDLEKFKGVYDLAPNFSLTISVSGGMLYAQGTKQPEIHLTYGGEEGGHPRFFSADVDAEIEFVPDASGAIASLVLHQGGDHPAKKR